MNTEEAIKELLLDTLVEGKDFVLDQAPEIVSQWLNMTAVTALSHAMIGVCILLLSVLILGRHYYLIKKKKGDRFEIIDLDHPVITILCGVGVPISLIEIIPNLMIFMQVYFFPKAYLLKTVL